MQSRSLLVWLLATMHGRRHALSNHDLPEELLASIFHCAQQRTCLKTCMLSGPNGRLQVVPPCSFACRAAGRHFSTTHGRSHAFTDALCLAPQLA